MRPRPGANDKGLSRELLTDAPGEVGFFRSGFTSAPRISSDNVAYQDRSPHWALHIHISD
jgi:hypothetical protein